MWNEICAIMEIGECKGKINQINEEIAAYAASRQEEIAALEERIKWQESLIHRY
jgi:peptidoglycan hydrolase CwlO-like protein